MMTRRERLERKLEKRQDWSDSASRKAEAAWEASRRATAGIPPGQPILVGHHSEKRHRKALERSDNALRRACENRDKAKEHASKADGLQRQLDDSVFTDDDDAIEQLEARIAEREAQAEEYKAINSTWRKAKGSIQDKAKALISAGYSEKIAIRCATTMSHGFSWVKSPMNTTPICAGIRRDKARIDQVRRRLALAREVEEAGGVLLTEHREDCAVAFPEYPGRDVVDALKGAGFHWSGGRWHGTTERLPSCVRTMVDAASQ